MHQQDESVDDVYPKSNGRRSGYAPRDPSAGVSDAKDTKRATVIPSISEQILSLKESSVPLKSGLPTLDLYLRGGFRPGRRYAKCAAPGVGKTTLNMQLLLSFVEQGAYVFVLACDEEARGLCSRLPQQRDGVHRDDLEDPTSDVARIEAAARFVDIAADVVDADDCDFTIEDAFAEGFKRAAGRRFVLVGDGIQTMRCIGETDDDSPSSQINKRLRAVKKLTKATQACVLMTSEVGRAHYPGSKAKYEVSKLAAGKESGGIEYGVDVQINLDREDDDIIVSIPKNRTGKTGDELCVLRFDAATCRFAELDETAGEPGQEPTGDRKTVRAKNSLRKDAEKIACIFRAQREPVRGQKHAREVIHANGGDMSNTRIGVAIAFLRQEGTIVEQGTESKPRWVVADVPPPSSEEVHDE